MHSNKCDLFTGSGFVFTLIIGQSAVACRTVSRLNVALNIDIEQRQALHHSFFNGMKLDTERGITQKSEKVDQSP